MKGVSSSPALSPSTRTSMASPLPFAARLSLKGRMLSSMASGDDATDSVDSLDGIGSGDHAAQLSPLDELRNMAFKLGEGYCAQDLTALLQGKGRILGSSAFVKPPPPPRKAEDSEVEKRRNARPYQVKVALLRALEAVTSDFKHIRRVPLTIVQTLFFELAPAYEEGIADDDPKCALIFTILGQCADFDEFCA
eukprot:CAMPEP_0170735036 /NCGR_PEP_ID=MMETSP0437-20130122/2894_1 /TAXON_ID=0 /ORGANISM="Sexangularia sp." /LENGTH=193 /DNA_ID=CAMNT_0011073359 /DNA_START=33 /DNA_END=610 /DNA_ORIENTATION=+